MTPKTRDAIAAAIAEISALTTEEFRARINSFSEDPLTLGLQTLSRFADSLDRVAHLRFSMENSDSFQDWQADFSYETLVDECLRWQTKAANDDRYLLAA
ncbi:hypothetical protein [Achromobacter ruhlandii]|uniref:hypothetical protein n=1 Tax=Achromobacter ruhlandii TaxID=72557 RepID=UPI00301955D7